jgi:phage tail sheath protein FI
VDREYGVHKAPVNQEIRSITKIAREVTDGEQELLNPEGINALRFFPGRGNLVWGARTLSPDSEWKYVNVRRFVTYLERSIDQGTQWTVFEPNGEGLWAKVRRTIEDFLLNLWQTGALQGNRPEDAFFVKCDRSTMTQNDIDNGRLICLVGVAVTRPAEFVIFRIGQWTAEHQSPDR